MSEPLKIAFVAAEVAPFSKTGGLADVAGALPAALLRRGHDVRVFTPLYSKIDSERFDFTPVEFLRQLRVDLGEQAVTFSVFSAKLPGSDCDVYFINCPQLYHRDGIYTGDWDEHLRFSLLSRAVFECCQRMGFKPDVLHANDWHSALVPLYRQALYGWDQLFADTKTVLTIHNLAYQGVFPAEVLGNLGLGRVRSKLFQKDLEQGAISFLKTGLLYADVVTTVSRTYAREIQTEAHGFGLDALLRERSSSVVGIVNGVDYGEWDPSVDQHIKRRYSIKSVKRGKRENKEHLLAELGLPRGERAPVLGIVSRLTGQKGFELMYDALPQMLRHLDVRLTVLGTGEEQYEGFFQQLQQAHPQKVCYYRGYNEPLAHLIEAGADIFLMPSRFEPCGLNQMYSLRYGTPPVVRKTGGLADTVEQFSVASGEGTGFVFDHYDSTGFAWALKRALEVYQDPDAWHLLRLNGMGQDYSWEKQSGEYEELYRQLCG